MIRVLVWRCSGWRASLFGRAAFWKADRCTAGRAGRDAPENAAINARGTPRSALRAARIALVAASGSVDRARHGCSSSKEQPQLAETTGGIDGWAAGASSRPNQRSQTVKYANAERRRAEAEAAQRRRLTAEGLVVPAPAPAPGGGAPFGRRRAGRASTAEADRLAAASVAAASTGPAVTPRTYGRRVDRARSSKATKASPAPEPSPPARSGDAGDDGGRQRRPPSRRTCSATRRRRTSALGAAGRLCDGRGRRIRPGARGLVRVRAAPQGRGRQVGLVPWFYLVSAAHAGERGGGGAGAADEAACASVVATPGRPARRASPSTPTPGSPAPSTAPTTRRSAAR